MWEQVHKEVGRLLKVEIASNMSKFFSTARIERILELLEKNKSTEVTSVLSAIGKATDYELSGEFVSVFNCDFTGLSKLSTVFRSCCFIDKFNCLYLLTFSSH